MMVAKRQGRGKPRKIEQRKVGGSSEDPQVEETALLASPIYKGQAQGEEEKNIKRGAKGPGVSHSCSLISLSPSPSLSLFSLLQCPQREICRIGLLLCSASSLRGAVPRLFQPG